ncbi:MAG: hypothetical protein WCG27_11870 [Pseudomonadota bacterium]
MFAIELLLTLLLLIVTLSSFAVIKEIVGRQGSHLSMDPKTCQSFMDIKGIPLFQYEKTLRKNNIMFVNVKVNENCQIISTNPTPYFYWIMGEKVMDNGLSPCQGLDNSDIPYWLPRAPLKEEEDGRWIKPKVVHNSTGTGSIMKYTMGFMDQVVARYSQSAVGETIEKALEIETFKNKEGKCEARNWATIRKGEEIRKLSVNSIFLVCHTMGNIVKKKFFGNTLGLLVNMDTDPAKYVILEGIDAQDKPVRISTE